MRNKKIFLMALGSISVLQAQQNTIKYPHTKQVEQTDVYHGISVADPYRWLEDDRSQETALWVQEQNKITQQYLNRIPYLNTIKNRLEKLSNYAKISAPFKEGEYTYFYKNDGLQNQSVLYRTDKNNKEEIFLDPNTLSPDGTTSLATISFSKDGSLVAYAISEAGSDWRKVIVIDAKTKKQIGETLNDIKFSGIAWKGNEGFFYSSYDKPKGSELSAKTDHHKLYYHKLGTPQSEDVLIFGRNENEKYRYVSGNTSNDGKFLFVTMSNATSGRKLLLKNINENSDFITILNEASSDSFVIDNQGDNLFISTNLNAPNGRLVRVNAKNPTPENWIDVIPETQNTLSVSKAGKFFFAHYMKNAISVVKQFDLKGNFIREIQLPSLGSASGFSAKETEDFTYFSFTNYHTPTQIYKLDLHSGKSNLYWSPKVNFNPNHYQSVQVFYTSKDGTQVPMILTYKKGTLINGKAPTILYGYGGFNVSLTPSFNVRTIAWLEQGGIYAVANLRGGGEFGKNWHNQGTKLQKQNVFNDFIAAAEYLIKHRYTSPEKLAINGGSNGGLLVGASLLQRPDLFKVAIPEVGVLDMLRYHKFTAGAGWAYDYGTADDNIEMFNYLKNYSPVHNVKKGVCYPAVLIATGDHDDRVVPAHSFKFAAELQQKQNCKNPTLIRIEINAGHGAGTPISKIIQKNADTFAFILWNMGYKKLPKSVK